MGWTALDPIKKIITLLLTLRKISHNCFEPQGPNILYKFFEKRNIFLLIPRQLMSIDELANYFCRSESPSAIFAPTVPLDKWNFERLTEIFHYIYILDFSLTLFTQRKISSFHKTTGRQGPPCATVSISHFYIVKSI